MFSAVLGGMAMAVLAAAGPDASAMEAPAKRFDVLGIQVCIGGDPVDGQPCHIKVYPPPPGQAEGSGADGAGEPAPVELSLFGTRVCIGAVPGDAACDVRLGASDPSEEDGVDA